MSFRNPDELKVIEDWYWAICDIRTGMPVLYLPTGTDSQYMQKRLVQNIYGKTVHIPDDGELDIVDGECGAYQVLLKCRICNQIIVAEM